MLILIILMGGEDLLAARAVTFIALTLELPGDSLGEQADEVILGRFDQVLLARGRTDLPTGSCVSVIHITRRTLCDFKHVQPALIVWRLLLLRDHFCPLMRSISIIVDLLKVKEVFHLD